MSAGVDVLVVGSANLDLVATTRRLPRPGETVLGSAYAEHAGGKGLNQAVSAARSGAVTAFSGAVGRDGAGRRLRSILAAEHIDTSAVDDVDEATGRALIVVDEAGENSIVVIPGANALVGPRSLANARVVLAQLEVPIATVEATMVAARRAGAITVLNPAPAQALASTLVAACDIVVPNEHEVALLGGESTLLAAGCGAVVTTRGGSGVDIVTRDRRHHQPSFPVDVIDTTGAGDAFCGALAARLAVGDTLDHAVAWAAAAGALATTVMGAVPAQPRAAAIEALLGR